MTEPTSAQDLFKGRHFDQEIIVLCVRWYLAFKLSSRDLVQMMAERGILFVVTHRHLVHQASCIIGTQILGLHKTGANVSSMHGKRRDGKDGCCLPTRVGQDGG